MIQLVDFDDSSRQVGYGETGRVMLTTLTREFFLPRFWNGTRENGSRPARPGPGTG